MKVVFVAPFMTAMVRGIERCVYEQAVRLARRGARVDILYWPSQRAWPYGSLAGLPSLHLHQLPLPRYYQCGGAGLLYPLYLRALKPDIVNLYYSWQGEEVAHRLWRGASTATVLNLQYPVEEVPARYGQLAASRVAARAGAIVACSAYVQEGARAALGREPIVIPNGVDAGYFAPADAETRRAARAALGIAPDRLVLLTVGALEERKGVLKAIAALDALRARGVDALYLVAGEGRQRAELERAMAARGLQARVLLAGVHADPRPFYHAADIFVFLARGEAAPLAPLEAMACGLAITASRRPPLDNLLSPAGTIFVDDDEPEDVAGAIALLAREPARRVAMGASNRARVVGDYGWDAVVDRFEALYRSIAPRGAVRPGVATPL